MSDIALKALGYYGGEQCRADIQCVTQEEFIDLPYELTIDNFVYQKSAFNVDSGTAYYFRPAKIEVKDASTWGRYRIITSAHGNLIVTHIEVEDNKK